MPPAQYAAEVSQPEVHRQVGRQRADVDALDELVEGVDHKLDALAVTVDRGFEHVDGQLANILRLLSASR